MGRKRAIGWRARIAAALLLVALAGGGWAWWHGQHWRPDPAAFPVQGVLVGSRDGRVDFNALRAIGASFAYLEASEGAAGRDRAFARNLRAARGSGLSFGAVHAYDPCVTAEKQSANFMTIVPRDSGLLPPAIALTRTAEGCEPRVSEAAVESELTTFLNQVEGHVGQPAVLLVSREFEEAYAISGRLERNLWLTRDWFQPDYAGRPWTLWTANSSYRSEASEEPLRWVVLQP
ncbi:MAG TPA: glycoside hydrolase family 25 protein [Myxococcota bacterium]|nr:glycoside hydrolase family 25 protein [Myxococcota bacterium]